MNVQFVKVYRSRVSASVTLPVSHCSRTHTTLHGHLADDRDEPYLKNRWIICSYFTIWCLNGLALHYNAPPTPNATPSGPVPPHRPIRLSVMGPRNISGRCMKISLPLGIVVISHNTHANNSTFALIKHSMEIILHSVCCAACQVLAIFLQPNRDSCRARALNMVRLECLNESAPRECSQGFANAHSLGHLSVIARNTIRSFCEMVQALFFVRSCGNSAFGRLYAR